MNEANTLVKNTVKRRNLGIKASQKLLYTNIVTGFMFDVSCVFWKNVPARRIKEKTQ